MGEVATNALRHDGPGTVLRAAVDRCTVRLTSHRLPRRGRDGSDRRWCYGLRSLEADVLAAGGTLYGPRDSGWQVVAEFGHRAHPDDGSGGVHAGG